MISTDHITEHSTAAPGLDMLVRVYDKGMTLTLSPTPMPQGTKGLSMVLKGSQIRALRKLLNLAVEEEQS